MSETEIELRSLYHYEDQVSNKDYIVSLVPVAGGWSATYSNGAHGKTMSNPKGKPDNAPRSYVDAKSVFDKMHKERLAKGYKLVADYGAPIYVASEGREHTGMQAHQPTASTVDEAESMISDDGWMMQEKHNGNRLMVRSLNGVVTGAQKQGLACGLPKDVIDAIRSVSGDFEIDGEVVGQRMFAFDVMSANGMDIRNLGADKRNAALVKLFGGGSGAVTVTPTAFTAEEKRVMFDAVRSHLGEGLVFKRKDAAYVAGKSIRDGSQRKVKFHESASVLVDEASKSKRSVSIYVNGPDGKFQLGKVTIPANAGIPESGMVVEVQYLRANKSGSLYETAYLGVRDDVSPVECTLEQIVFKTH